MENQRNKFDQTGEVYYNLQLEDVDAVASWANYLVPLSLSHHL